MNASLDRRLSEVKWGEFRLTDVFTVVNTHCILSRDVACNSGDVPYLCASSENNAVSSFISYDEQFKEKGNCIFIGGKTFVVSYQEKDFFSNDSHNLALYFKSGKHNKAVFLFMASCINSSLRHKYSWGDSVSNEKIIKESIMLPIREGTIDFDFMETYVADLEAERVAELEAYLRVTGLNEYELNISEKKIIEQYNKIKWESFNLQNLFGKSTRGKRLKSEDRIPGLLPFVTAGEAGEGISAYIGNKVEVFRKNTTTIDMFGSAKYRDYEYGADDHIAVVHTESLPMKASIFVTSAIHKASHTGKFDYGHNFYAKDADNLNIMLPIKDGKPDYELMNVLISAIQKLVIKAVVNYSNSKIMAKQEATVQKEGKIGWITYPQDSSYMLAADGESKGGDLMFVTD